MSHENVDAGGIGRGHARERGAARDAHGNRIAGKGRDRIAELIASADVDETVVVVDVVEVDPISFAIGCIRIGEGLERDLFEVGFADRDGLGEDHRVGAASGACRQHAEHRARGQRDHDDRHDELDQRDAALAFAAHDQGA